ncbi:phage tail protein [Sandarakinorhabdus sp.]|uniref:phage tail protein n=1 Tax=Sandarakinorhabdus sp. TaxID=1916663 RepID=UPI00286D9FB4|nr:phage tail protein [Sandarakinorhabdus sp.]
MPESSARPYPFLAFKFAVEIMRAGQSKPLAEAAFADCDGLEITMEVKTIKEGGAPDRAIRVAGHVSYANLTLKRGMTENFDLWTWFKDSVADPRLRADAEVVLLGPDGSERARFLLSRCMPVKLKAPALSAMSTAVAIEEMQIAYETLTFKAGKAAA